MSKTLLQRSLLASTVIAGMAFASPAFAQDPAVAAAAQDTTEATQETPADTPAATDPADRDDSTIVVTGSRIVSPNIVSLAPIQVVGEADIDQSGAINIQEVLLENPIFGTPGLSRTNSAFLTQAAGTATVDLRDLGSDRTLVLINSRRVVAGVPGSATVDLNVIPTQFVERIDLLTGGASSLYGSDAVAGVVNFIYKRNFEGLLAEGSYGITQRGDSARYQISMTGGGNFADDRGNLMVHLGYTNEDGLLSRQRKDSRIDNVSRFWYFTGDPDDLFTPQLPFFSSFVPQGRFEGTAFSFNPVTNELFPCFSTNTTPTCVGVNGGTATTPFGFNRQHYRTLAVPVERYLFASRGTFEVTNNINAFLEGTYSKTTSSREIEPFALDSSDVIPSGLIPVEQDIGGVLVRNPFVPDIIFNQADDDDGDGLRDITFARRLSEVGTRNSNATRDFWRLVVGLEGKVLQDRFSWDLSYNYGQTTESQRSNGQVNVVNFRNALNSVVDATDLDDDGNTTEIICVDEVARAQGCVPINIFGLGSITPEALQYVAAEIQLRNKITQQVWAANISGSAFELPAGPLGVAVGAEYRKETSEEDWDSLTNQGLNAGNATPDTFGDFNVKEIYGEVNVPILAERPFFHQLNLRAAGRLSDYSTVGSIKTWNVGADWAPIEALRFRGTYAVAVRAPNIGELFTGPSQTFPTGLEDPCVGVTTTSTGTISEQCRADVGVLANIARSTGVGIDPLTGVAFTNAFTQTQADQQGISGFNAGNPNLTEETAKSLTLGAVFAPRDLGIGFLRNLVLSVDYYRIKITDAVNFPDRDTILEQCFEEANEAFCQFVLRRPVGTGSNTPGSIEFVNSGAVNSSVIKTAGIDTVIQYRTGLDSLMNGWNLNARVAWTHLLEGYSIDLPGAPKDRFAGEIGTSKDRVNGSIALNSDKWGVSFTGTYIGPAFEDDRSLAPEPRDFVEIPAEFYLDTQVTFTPARAYELFLGVDNLLDNKAPAILQGSDFNVTGSQTAADVYDIFGRRFYAGARLRF